MIEGKTKRGFDYTLNDDVLDDWDLLESLTKLDKGDTSAIVEVSMRLLGEEQYKRMKDFLRKDGKLKASDFVQEISEILLSSKETKN